MTHTLVYPDGAGIDFSDEDINVMLLALRSTAMSCEEASERPATSPAAKYALKQAQFQYWATYDKLNRSEND